MYAFSFYIRLLKTFIVIVPMLILECGFHMYVSPHVFTCAILSSALKVCHH